MISTLSQLAPAPAAGVADVVKDVALATFMVDVVEASKTHIIVVDFWAPWCEPCKQLTPVLEKLVRSYKGALHLAKIDIDQNPDIAQQMGVQSIPAVFAFFKGRPVDGFMGVQPEAQIKSWLERIVKATGGDAEVTDDINIALKQAAEFFAAHDIPTAQAIYADVLDREPANIAGYAGMLRCLIALGDTDRAKQMLASAAPEMTKDKAFDPVRAALELSELAGQSGSVAELQKKVEQNPADYQARFDLSMAHYAKGQKEEAVDQLLEIVRRNRSWNEDAARKQLVKFFEAFGQTDPLTIASRKRLSSLLFA